MNATETIPLPTMNAERAQPATVSEALPRRRVENLIYNLSRLFAFLLAKVVLGVSGSGWRRLPRSGGLLLTPNHRSYADALLVAAMCPRRVRFMGASNMQRIWWIKLLYRVFGVIAVDPGKPHSALRAAIHALKAGECVCIFPEGDIPIGPRPVMPFKPGAAFVAKTAGVPVVPVLLQYCETARVPFLHRSLVKRLPKYRHPWRAVTVAGSPQSPESLNMSDLRENILDMGLDSFAQKPELKKGLAELALRNLAKRPFHRHVVDYATERKQLNSGMLLAVALTLGARWRKTIPEERVGVVFPSGLGSMLVNLALTLIGKTPVNLNFTAGRMAQEKSISKSGITTIITAGPVIERFPEFPWVENTIDLQEESKSIKKPVVIWTLLRIILLPSSWLMGLFKVSRSGGEATAGLLFSSGSTGDPKGVELTHRNIIANCAQIESCGLLVPSEKLLAFLPTFHSFGFTVTLWYPLLHGLKVVYLPSPLDTKKIADVVEAEQATVLVATPTFLRPYFKRIDPEKLKSLRFVVAGAEKTPKGFAERWVDIFGCEYLEGYGLTETSPVVACNLPHLDSGQVRSRLGSVGKLFPGMRAKVVDPVTGEGKAVDEQGILCLQGPNVFNGYLDDEKATRACFLDGWFVTGDLGRIDEDGFLFIEGRVSRFSKIGGEMVPHGTVEQTVMEVFSLEDSAEPLVAVTGVNDEQKGERLVLLSAVEIKPDSLRQRLLEKGIPNLWVPKTIKRVDAIPCLASGKLDLRRLKELAERE